MMNVHMAETIVPFKKKGGGRQLKNSRERREGERGSEMENGSQATKAHQMMAAASAAGMGERRTAMAPGRCQVPPPFLDDAATFAEREEVDRKKEHSGVGIHKKVCLPPFPIPSTYQNGNGQIPGCHSKKAEQRRKR